MITHLSLLSLIFIHAAAQVTIYQTTSTASSAAAEPTLCIGAVPCDGNVLTPMANPTGPNLTTALPVQLLSSGGTGFSVPLSGSFMGFSIELSVANQLIGNDGNKTNPIFLNLMGTVTSRAGKVLVRVGGNSQESAAVALGGLPNDTAIEKLNKAFTPTLLLSPTLVYAMGNISSKLPVDWFLGVPFNDTSNPRLTLAEIAQQVLGKNLIGLQLGNEPDLYAGNGLRPSSYQPSDFTADWGVVLQDYINDPAIPNKNMFVGPSVCCGGGGGGWTPEMVFDTGFLTSFSQNLAYISVEHYPTNNCNITAHLDPNELMSSTFLNHPSVQSLSEPYLNTSQIAAGLGKPFIMFETNTASCGGFSGLSDSFASAMWGVDYSLSMASNNFSNALFHVGGESDYYNPFTPPPTNQSHFRQWTIGPIFYSALVVAEALGRSNVAQVVDMSVATSPFSPVYGVYENGAPQRVVLLNYLTDASGASNYTAYISVGGNQSTTAAATPASVQVKYLLSPSAVEKFNISWAGQTFGGAFESDGQLTGTEQIYTYSCNTAENVCAIPMPAPAVAIVYLNSNALSEGAPTTTQTFASATPTKSSGTANTATVAQAVLATSNGRGGGQWDGFGSTSPGSSDALANAYPPTAVTGLLLAYVFGLTLLIP